MSLQNKQKKVCETNTKHKQGNLMISVLTLTPDDAKFDSAGRVKEKVVTKESKRKTDDAYC